MKRQLTKYVGCSESMFIGNMHEMHIRTSEWSKVNNISFHLRKLEKQKFSLRQAEEKKQ